VAYAPYGERYANSVGTIFNFTGMDNDTKSDLYDFPAREYHPTQGRWVSPDPAGLQAVEMTNPQSWNRYAYVANTPLTAVDPLGLVKSDATGWYHNTCEGWGSFGCSYFQGQLDASNRGIDFSFGSYSDWGDRRTFGGNYYNFSGNANPREVGLGSYLNKTYGSMGSVSQDGAGHWTTTIPGGCVDVSGSLGESGHSCEPPITVNLTFAAGILPPGVDPLQPRRPVKPFKLPLPNVPSGAACNKYSSGGLRFVCNMEPNSPTNNCVRGTLLNSYDPLTGYRGGIRDAHCNAFASCGLSPWNPAQIFFGCDSY
jgi:RHS repeat-associated protein